MKNFTRLFLIGLVASVCFVSSAQAQRIPISGDVRNYNETDCGLEEYDEDKNLRVYYRLVNSDGSVGTRNNATIYALPTGAAYSINGFDIVGAGTWGFYIDPPSSGTTRLYEIDIREGTDVEETVRQPVPMTTGFINIKEFPYFAKGDGVADDTLAIQNAITDLGRLNGGRLYFPNGVYIVTHDSSHPLPISLPSHITLEGNGAGTYGSSRIQLATEATSIFKIVGCRERITMRDLTLNRDPAIAITDTVAVLASDVANKSSLEFLFSNMTFQRFDRAIEVNAVDGGWQFDNVKVDHCSFTENKIGIKMNTPNTDWKIVSSWFYIPSGDNYGVYMTNAGFILIENTFGGGGQDFIHAKMVANLTVINSQCEGSAHSIVFGNARVPNDSDEGAFPALITLVGNQFANPIDLNHRCTFISTANHYGPQTVTAATKLVRIHSTGDRFCYDGLIPGDEKDPLPANQGCRTGGFQGSGTIVFQTGQLGEYVNDIYNDGVEARPTVITGNTEVFDGDDFEIDLMVNGLKPLFSLNASTNINKPLLRIGQPGANDRFYDFKRESNGYLSIFGKQSNGGGWYRGVTINGPLQLHKVTRAGLAAGDWTATATAGALLYCEDCAPSADCSTSGSGAMAIRLASSWRCN